MQKKMSNEKLASKKKKKFSKLQNVIVFSLDPSYFKTS